MEAGLAFPKRRKLHVKPIKQAEVYSISRDHLEESIVGSRKMINRLSIEISKITVIQFQPKLENLF
jgi:hypothetical protein